MSFYKDFYEEYHDNINRYERLINSIEKICNDNDELKGGFNIIDCDIYRLAKHKLANKILDKIKEVRYEEEDNN